MTILLKIIGLINAFYLLSLHATPNKGCMIGETCSEVLSSVYASVWGIPLAAIGVSVFAILLLAGLLGIPKDPIEAAKVEGCNSWQVFKNITFRFFMTFVFSRNDF